MNKSILLLPLFLLSLSSWGFSQTGPAYVSNFDSALAQAKKTGKPIVAIFTGKH